VESATRELPPCHAPSLKEYGTVAEVTLTVNMNMNKNDSIPHGNNLKT
jgi:hypothetical protein